MTAHPPLHQLIYFSRRAPDSSISTIEFICERAFAANRASGITGLLLYNSNLFLQFIEGPREAVRALYARIRQDERHYDVNVIWENESEERLFADGAAMRIEHGDYERFAAIAALAELDGAKVAEYRANDVRTLGAVRLLGFREVARLNG
jgi:hypothetical protein